jgi:hypothetical protein
MDAARLLIDRGMLMAMMVTLVLINFFIITMIIIMVVVDCCGETTDRLRPVTQR